MNTDEYFSHSFMKLNLIKLLLSPSPQYLQTEGRCPDLLLVPKRGDSNILTDAVRKKEKKAKT